MKNLLRKEISLAMHPTAIIFLLLSGMVIIPNYPYYVTFFYTGLGIYFMCLSGRENHDVFYSMTLPVAKKDIVRARFTYVVIMELLQMLIAVPFAILRQSFEMPGNQVGMDANIAFFGLSLIMLGLFNFLFFRIYYKNVDKVGKAFIVSSITVFLYMGVAETATHVVPFFRDELDTKDPEFLGSKLVVLGIGAVVYVLLTLLAYKRSVKTFSKMDL